MMCQSRSLSICLKARQSVEPPAGTNQPAIPIDQARSFAPAARAAKLPARQPAAREPAAVPATGAHAFLLQAHACGRRAIRATAKLDAHRLASPSKRSRHYLPAAPTTALRPRADPVRPRRRRSALHPPSPWNCRWRLVRPTGRWTTGTVPTGTGEVSESAHPRRRSPSAGVCGRSETVSPADDAADRSQG